MTLMEMPALCSLMIKFIEVLKSHDTTNQGQKIPRSDHQHALVATADGNAERYEQDDSGDGFGYPHIGCVHDS